MSTENFTGRAEAYAIGRPGYPQVAIDYVCTLVPHNAIFADIGAGTGLFTEKLAMPNYTIYAIEPNKDMRVQLALTLTPYPNVTIFDGTDEATNLPDHSVDVITVAHALHWFNIDAFRKECLRILKPNGLVVVIYNLLSDGSGEVTNLSKQAVDAFFQNPAIMTFPNPIEYTKEKWLAYITSQDNTPLPTDPGYDAHVAEVNKSFDRDSVDGLLTIDRMTKIFSERIA